jgi:hypothetical protein
MEKSNEQIKIAVEEEDVECSSDNNNSKNKRKGLSSSTADITAAEETVNKDVSSPIKRPKLDTEVQSVVVETVVTPNSNSAAAAAAPLNNIDGGSSPPADSTKVVHTDTNEAPLDLATTLGYKDGDRLEVQWEIHNDDDINDEDDDDNNNNNTRTVWWKATLLKHDGRTTDSVAIRTLLYDARPDLGFPEPSKEDVVFLGADLLVSPHDESVQLQYKREGLTEAENQLWLCNDHQLDEQLNQIVMGTLQKNERVWKAMPAAAQAAIADKMRRMKDKMKEKLQALGPQVVITSETIQKLLAESF